jgi:hypothetical protein
MNLPGEASHPNDMDGRRWCVMRQDDNGNRFVVADALTEADARLLSASYAARAHKQLYWVEPMTITDPPDPSEPPEPPEPATRS